MSYLKKPRGRSAAAVSTIALAVSLTWSLQAHAAEAPPAGAEVEGVEVTASRYQTEQAVDNRRNALTVVDTLTQDDTGDLSDQSMAEALRRVPGVMTIYDEDEGQFITIRGIPADYNHVTLDGMTLASVGANGNGERNVDLALIPSQSARKAEVYKTFNADMDSDNIGGIVNIVPRSAFDTRKPTYGVFDVFANYFTYNDVPGVNSRNGKTDSKLGGGFNATFSKRFGSDEQFGLVLAANYQAKQRDETKSSVGTRAYYNDAGKAVTPDDPTWNGIAVPNQFVMYNYVDQIVNGGVAARFEYKPSDRWYSSLQLFDYIQRESEDRNTNNLLTLTNPKTLTPTTGTEQVGEGRIAYYNDMQHRANMGGIFHSRYQPDDRSQLDIAASYTFSDFRNTHPELIYNFMPKTPVNYQIHDGTASFTLPNAEIYRDPKSYTLKSATDENDDSEAQVAEFKVDYAHELGGGWSYKVGADIQKLGMWRDNNFVDYVSDKSSLSQVSIDPNFTPNGYPYPLLFIDNRKFWETVAPKLGVNAKASAVDSLAPDYKYDETHSAAYVMATYSTEHLRVIGGLRYDNVDFTGKTPLTLNGVAQPGFSKADGGFGHLLPSLNALYEINPNLRLKAAYSRTLGLPSGADVAQPATRNDDTLTIKRGNADIKPRVADNFDLTVEQYFNRGQGLFSLSAFHKNIAHDIYNATTTQVIDGETYQVQQPTNASSSKMDGVEFQLVDSRLNFLPGVLGKNLGASLNGVRLWGKMHYVQDGQELTLNYLTDQSKVAGNAAIFYALPRGGEVRIAYNYQGKYTDSVDVQPWLNTGWKAYGTWDVTVRHQLTDRLILKLQARNLTNANRVGLLGQDLQYNRVDFEYGRSFYVNLVYKM